MNLLSTNNDNSTTKNNQPLTPELLRGPLFVWEHENQPYNEVAKLSEQEKLIQHACDNPYGFATLDECMAAISPYIFLPIEEEKYLSEIIAKLRDFQEKAYTYDKDSEGKTTFKKVYHASAMTTKLYELLKGSYLSKKYGSFAGTMIRSRKSSKTLESKRKHIRQYLIMWAKERIWERGWKQTHKQGIRDITANKIVNTFSIPTSLDITTDHDDLKRNPPKPHAFRVSKSKKVKFDKKSLTSLFQQTGDAELDQLLDKGREYIENPGSCGYSLQPGQILLRKYNPSSDRPLSYTFRVIRPKYLEKYYPPNSSSAA